MNNYVISEENSIDLSNVSVASNIIIELSKMLEQGQYESQKIKLFVGNLSLNTSQLLAIKTILGSINSEIGIIYTTSLHTQASALDVGIMASDINEQQQEIMPVFEETNDDERLVISEVTETEEIPQLEQKEKISHPKPTEMETLYIKQTLRSGQTVTYDGNVIIIGDCHPGSEIIAGGDVTIWGILGGIAHAGAKGNEDCSIRALRINAIQLRIAGYYARRPDKIEIEKVTKTSTFTPEEAKINNGEIIIYTLNN